MRRPKRGARRCALTVAVATMSVQGHAGHDVVSFSGLVHDRELAPGRYTLVLIAATGELVSKPRQISFAIVG